MILFTVISFFKGDLNGTVLQLDSWSPFYMELVSLISLVMMELRISEVR
jgi:hypothetical protein